MSSTTSGGPSYNLTNLNGTISLFLNKSIEIKAGLGLSPSSIGDYNKTLFSVPVDINFHLPFNISGFGLALSLRAQETLGIPTDNGTEDTKATSEFINVGFFITTPLVLSKKTSSFKSRANLFFFASFEKYLFISSNSCIVRS